MISLSYAPVYTLKFPKKFFSKTPSSNAHPWSFYFNGKLKQYEVNCDVLLILNNSQGSDLAYKFIV